MKASDRNFDRRKQKNSSDIFSDDKVESLSSEIQKMYESFRLIEMLEEIRRNEFKTNIWFAYNFIIQNPAIEKPISQKFYLYTPKITQRTNPLRRTSCPDYGRQGPEN